MAITPAAAAVSPLGAIVLGVVAGALCSLAVGLKARFGFDDSLDVVGVHLVGGLVGTVLIGFLSTETGLFYGHGTRQLVVQIVIALAAVVFSGVVTLVIALVLKAVMGWRITPDEERAGIDISRHAEAGYDLVGSLASRLDGRPVRIEPAPAPAPTAADRTPAPTGGDVR